MKLFRTSEEKYIRDNYGKVSLAEMAKHLGRTKSTVQAHVKLMGLKLSPEQFNQRQEIGRFKKGSVPHNAGTKGKMKPNNTSFRPGQLPHNTKHDGAITIRQRENEKPYKFVRLASGQWKHLHRHVWEQANGPAPSGWIVAFKDGDTMNCELDNLMLMSRKDNLFRNRNFEKQAESMKHRWKVKKALAKHKQEFPHLFD